MSEPYVSPQPEASDSVPSLMVNKNIGQTGSKTSLYLKLMTSLEGTNRKEEFEDVYTNIRFYQINMFIHAIPKCCRNHTP